MFPRHSTDDLRRVLDRLETEDRLRCVVDGETTNDGRPAQKCTEFISHPEQMCAGCAASHMRHPHDVGRHKDRQTGDES